MSDKNIVLPSKPRIVKEEGFTGVYEIDGLYPGYGHTLGNSLRRIILSSIEGAAISSVKIDGVSHEFSVLNGIKEDVITILLNLKRIRIKMLTDEPQTVTLKAKGIKEVKAGDLEVPGQVEIMNKDQHIASLTDKSASLNLEIRVERGLGYVSKEVLQKDRVEIGVIALDANFSPVRRVNYEVENMRVGDRTDFNRLRILIETDGIISPREALEKSISLMISQLKAVVGFKEEEEVVEIKEESTKGDKKEEKNAKEELDAEFLKTRIESMNLSARTINALTGANIRTLGGLVRKKEADIMEIDGIGGKGMQEIKKMLGEYGVTLK